MSAPLSLATFDFDLPPERIALRPAVPRDAARLLVTSPSPDVAIGDRLMRDLPELLRPGDALVVNTTKVIHAELVGQRARGEARATIHVNLHKRASGDRWWAFARPAKRLAIGDQVRFGLSDEGRACALGTLTAEVIDKADGGDVLLRFDLAGPVLDDAIAQIGRMPLPPYIGSRRASDARDDQDYQTIYAQDEGSVAAPTAGLHFTDEMLARVRDTGVSLHSVTLHVGAGTFLPVKTDDVRQHRMHAEWGEVSAPTAAALEAVRRDGGRIVAVGTTTTRLLETAARSGAIEPFCDETDIFITPGFRFRAVDLLLTNFHLPKSTLFMLVCAFAGTERARRAYAHAIAHGYRFFSYGDASLFARAEDA